MYLLEREIIVNADPDQVWEFLSTPVNLNQLTPADFHFRILSDIPAKMYNGLTILYEIQIPLFGKRRWLTEIKHINPGVLFIDEQRAGPYKLWYHHHEIEHLGNKQTKIIDRVFYQMPFGILGSLVHHVWVKNMLTEVFDFRVRRLLELFGKQETESLERKKS